MEIKSLNKIEIKERLKKTDKEAFRLVECLEDLYDQERKITNKSIRKMTQYVLLWEKLAKWVNMQKTNSFNINRSQRTFSEVLHKMKEIKKEVVEK